MLTYIAILIGIGILISLLIASAKLLYIIRLWDKYRLDPVIVYIFCLFMSIVVYSIAELVNLIMCMETYANRTICVVSWEIFSIGQ